MNKIAETARQEHANWHCKATLYKYHEDIDEFARRKTWWARVLRHVPALYKRVIGVLEQEFYKEFKPYEVIKMAENVLLNTGIDEMWDLITGAVSGASHIYDNAAATIGVGDSDTAAAAAQTDLQAASNKTYKAMEAGYPTSTTQKVTFKSSFGSSDANYAWKEWVVKQSTSAICLNRKVESLGTKASGTWTLEVDITLS
jgi:hypothetical protein